MRCKHEKVKIVNEHAYSEVTMAEYKCNICGRKGFYQIPEVEVDKSQWDDSL